MIDWETILYVFVNGAIFMLSALGLDSAIATPSLDRWEKRFFAVFFADLVACSTVFFLELAVVANPDMTALLVVAYFLDSLFCSVPFPLLALYLLHCCGEDWRGSSLFRTVLALWAAYLVMLVVAQFTTAFYYVSPDNQLRLGPLYLLSVAPVLAMLLILAAGVISKQDELSRRHRRAFLVCLLPITLAVFIHTFNPSYALIGIGLAIAAFSMYRVIESASAEQHLHQLYGHPLVQCAGGERAAEAVGVRPVNPRVLPRPAHHRLHGVYAGADAPALSPVAPAGHEQGGVVVVP